MGSTSRWNVILIYSKKRITKSQSHWIGRGLHANKQNPHVNYMNLNQKHKPLIQNYVNKELKDDTYVFTYFCDFSIFDTDELK